MPANVFVRSHSFTVNQDLHPLVVETVWLTQIQNVESHRLTYQVACFKEVPLSMPVSVHVVLEQKMVVLIVYFNGSGQISGLKPTLKYEC